MRSPVSRLRVMARTRACWSRDATYRAAPAARYSSIADDTCGMVAEASVAARPRTNISSIRENAATVHLLMRRGCGRPRHGELRPQFEEALLPDALNVHQFFHLAEWSFLRAVVDNPGSHLGTDAG